MNQFIVEGPAICRVWLFVCHPMCSMVIRGGDPFALSFEMANEIAMRHAAVALPIRNRADHKNITLDLVIQTCLDYPIKTSVMICRCS